MARFSRIIGTGGYLPERVLTNAELELSIDTTDALSSVDLIVVATTTPDRVFPSTACLLQSRLDMHGGPAFDVQAVCSGFVYALSVADHFIKAGTVVLRADDRPGILSTHLHADGDYADLLHVPKGVSTSLASVQAGTAYVEMAGREVFRMAVQKLGEVVDEALEANGLERGDIDCLVPHQANIRIIAATAKKLGMSMDRVVLTVAEHGNTSAASIPLALDVAVRRGDIKDGDRLLLEGFGGGFTWGGALIEWRA